MKNEKAKYLIVNATDITKQLYEVERVAYSNDFDNIIHRIEKISAEEIFIKNNVPEEFRKIIIKISKSIFSKKEAEELIMGYPFDYAAKTTKDINDKKYIRMNNCPFFYDGTIFDDKIVFNAEEQYTSYNNVMYFLEEVYKNGCLDNYLQSIKEFFDMSLDLDLLFEAWNQTHNRRKALSLYKHKVASQRVLR